MGIIVKYILKSIMEKKLRSFLILFSITVSSALLFASFAITGSLMNMFEERMKQYYGTSDFMIHASRNSNMGNFNTDRAEPFKRDLEYIIGGFRGSATYRQSDVKSVSISLIGMDLVRHRIVSPVDLVEQTGLYPFEGKKIIVGTTLAERFGWKLGDSVELRLNDTRHKFIVSGVAAPEWFLFDDGESFAAIVPEETLAALYDMRGRENVLYVKLKNPEQKETMLELFQEAYKGCGYSTFSMSTDIDIPLKLLTVIVCFMSVFILYTTFRVIALERIPVIGTFRSIGAARRTTSLLLLAESSVYGILGGLSGCLAGIGVLYLMTGSIKDGWTRNIQTTITFTQLHLVIAFSAAVLLCVVSSAVPILRISRIPIKDIVLNTIDKPQKKGWWKGVLGMILVAVSILVPGFIPDQLSLPVDMACLVLLGIGAVLLVPYLTGVVVRLMEFLYTLLFGNIGVLAAKNLRENKSILNSISLLCIGIATLLLVTVASDSMLKEVINIFDSAYRFDIISYRPANRYAEQLIRSIEGVSSTNGVYAARHVGIRGFSDSIQIDGLGSTKYFDFWNIDIGKDPGDTIKQLDSGRNLLLSNSLRQLLGIRKGDRLMLQMPKGDREYTVIGFFDTALSGGNHALASERFVMLDTGNRNYNSINIKTSGDPALVAENIRYELRRMNPMVETISEMKKMSLESNGQIIGILSGFAALTLLIGVIGVFNNLMISFLERKHSLAVLKSVGMSRTQTLTMVFIEALSGGLIGGIAGSVTGTLQLLIVPAIMRATGQYFPIHLDLRFHAVFLAVGVLITMISSISPALRSSRLDITSSLKYE